MPTSLVVNPRPPFIRGSRRKGATIFTSWASAKAVQKQESQNSLDILLLEKNR